MASVTDNSATKTQEVHLPAADNASRVPIMPPSTLKAAAQVSALEPISTQPIVVREKVEAVLATLSLEEKLEMLTILRRTLSPNSAERVQEEYQQSIPNILHSQVGLLKKQLATLTPDNQKPILTAMLRMYGIATFVPCLGTKYDDKMLQAYEVADKAWKEYELYIDPIVCDDDVRRKETLDNLECLRACKDCLRLATADLAHHRSVWERLPNKAALELDVASAELNTPHYHQAKAALDAARMPLTKAEDVYKLAEEKLKEAETQRTTQINEDFKLVSEKARGLLQTAIQTSSLQVKQIEKFLANASEDIKSMDAVYQSRPDRVQLEKAHSAAVQEQAAARLAMEFEMKAWLAFPSRLQLDERLRNSTEGSADYNEAKQALDASRQNLTRAEIRLQEADVRLKKANKAFTKILEIKSASESDYHQIKFVVEYICEDLRSREKNAIDTMTRFEKRHQEQTESQAST